MRDKSGVSPVIATLLLVIIAVAAAIIVYAWTTMFTTMQTGRAGTVIAAESVVKISKGPAYEDRYEYVFNVTVRNIGPTEVSVVDVYLNGTRLALAAAPSNPGRGEWVIKGSTGVWGDPAVSPGYVGLVSFKQVLRKGYPCTVRVATAQGAYSDISFYPP